MDIFQELLLLVTGATPWWLLVLAIPFARIYWDSRSRKRFKVDRQKMREWNAQNLERKRENIANMLGVSLTAILTIFGISADSKLDHGAEEKLRVLGAEYKAVREEIATVVLPALNEARDELDGYREFRETVALKADLLRLEDCTWGWLVTPSDDALAPDEDCFSQQKSK